MSRLPQPRGKNQEELYNRLVWSIFGWEYFDTKDRVVLKAAKGLEKRGIVEIKGDRIRIKEILK